MAGARARAPRVRGRARDTTSGLGTCSVSPAAPTPSRSRLRAVMPRPGTGRRPRRTAAGTRPPRPGAPGCASGYADVDEDSPPPDGRDDRSRARPGRRRRSSSRTCTAALPTSPPSGPSVARSASWSSRTAPRRWARGRRRAMVGSLGDVATFSFYPTKNLGALGDGGAVVDLGRRRRRGVRSLRQYGWREQVHGSARTADATRVSTSCRPRCCAFASRGSTSANARRREIIARVRGARVRQRVRVLPARGIGHVGTSRSSSPRTAHASCASTSTRRDPDGRALPRARPPQRRARRGVRRRVAARSPSGSPRQVLRCRASRAARRRGRAGLRRPRAVLTTTPSGYSVVVPVYGNEATLPAVVERLEKVAARLDGASRSCSSSTARPTARCDVLAADPAGRRRDRTRQLIAHSRNFGSFPAIRTGMRGGSGASTSASWRPTCRSRRELMSDFFAALAVRRARRRRRDGVSRATTRRSTSLHVAHVLVRSTGAAINPAIPRGGVDVFGCTREVAEAVLACDEAHSSLVGLLYWVGYPPRRGAVRSASRAHEGRVGWSLRKRVRYLLDSVFSFTDLPITLLSDCRGRRRGADRSSSASSSLVRCLTGAIDELGYTPLMLVILLLDVRAALRASASSAPTSGGRTRTARGARCRRVPRRTTTFEPGPWLRRPIAGRALGFAAGGSCSPAGPTRWSPAVLLGLARELIDPRVAYTIVFALGRRVSTFLADRLRLRRAHATLGRSPYVAHVPGRLPRRARRRRGSVTTARCERAVLVTRWLRRRPAAPLDRAASCLGGRLS